MYPLTIKDSQYSINNISLLDLAKEYGTPTYIYDLGVIAEKLDSLKKSFKWPKLRICYAMKANSNMDVLKLLRSKGASIDAVSYGDILIALKAGFLAKDIIFTCNNVSDEEIDNVHKLGVLINIGDLSRLEKFGKKNPGSRICLRINTEIESGENDLVKTAGKESQFGLLLEDVDSAIDIVGKYKLSVIGIHEHTGSGLYNTEEMFESIKRTLDVAKKFRGLEFVDFGGGFKVPYKPEEKRVDYESFGERMIDIFTKFCKEYGKDLELVFEPGKYMVAESGILLVEVNTIKKTPHKIYAGVNSGFSQLIRPLLYGAYHNIVNVSNPSGPQKKFDVAGNICEGGDIFAKDRMISEIKEGDILVIQNAGAYCYSMASVYNNRPLPAEIIVQDGKHWISKKRLSFKEYAENYINS